MKVHFREQYGTKGEEILYVTPAGKRSRHFVQPRKGPYGGRSDSNADGIELLTSSFRCII